MLHSFHTIWENVTGVFWLFLRNVIFWRKWLLDHVESSLEYFKVALHIARCTPNVIQYQWVILLSQRGHTGPKRVTFWGFWQYWNLKNPGLQGVKMGTKMTRGPSLKSLSLLRTFYLWQIMILSLSLFRSQNLLSIIYHRSWIWTIIALK